MTSGGNIDVTTAALMYAKFATPATAITPAPTASGAPAPAAGTVDSTNNYVKVLTPAFTPCDSPFNPLVHLL